MRTYGEVIEVRTAAPVEASPSAASYDGRSGPARTAPPAQSLLPAPPAQSLLPAPPAQFLWRGRLYLVREVLAHWVELGTWWTARSPRTSAPATPATPATSVPVPGAAGSRSVSADVGAVEREVWRVEAASGRTSRIGVYDLVRDVPAPAPAAPGAAPSAAPARWRLARALD